MISLLWLLLTILASPFKSKYQLEAENVALRHQVVVLRRQGRGRVRLTNVDAAAGPAPARACMAATIFLHDACGQQLPPFLRFNRAY
jgi:hypothetical protein